MRFTPEVPFVCKVGHAEAGYGKILFETTDRWEEFVGVLALNDSYATCEKFFPKDYDLRIQKVGQRFRAYSRTASNWKTNVGTSILKEISVEARWIKYATLASTIFGGLDILTVDIMVLSDGREVIIEVNDTASGFAKENKLEDMQHCVELCADQWGKKDQKARLQAIGRQKQNLVGQ